MLHSNTAALIITYRRISHLGNLVDLCVKAGIHRIYISSDGAKGLFDQDDVTNVRREISRLGALHPEKIIVNFSDYNLGAALNVLSSCDWIFNKENFAVVLEDDCVPSIDFFSFVEDHKNLLRTNKDIYMICGTQFAPASKTDARACLSIYPMVWGWATSREKWLQASNKIRIAEQGAFSIFKISDNDSTFWRAGARRAKRGFVDAWDIPLVYAIRQLGGRVIAPGINLVSNIGGDGYATHTVDGSKWLEQEVGIYKNLNFPIVDNPDVDDWIKKKVFGISLRHQFSVRYTWLLDQIGIHKPIRKPLDMRWRISASDR